MGTYTSISLSAPSEERAGENVYVTATVRNLYSSSVKRDMVITEFVKV